jgi:hypothetical protein
MARTKQTARPNPNRPRVGPSLIGVVKPEPVKPKKSPVPKPAKVKPAKAKKSPVPKPVKAPKNKASTIKALPACFSEIHRLFPEPFLSLEWFKLVGIQLCTGVQAEGHFKTEQECEHFRDYVAWTEYYANIVAPIPEASRVVNMPFKFAKVHKLFPEKFLSPEWFELINVQQTCMLMGNRGVLKNSSRATLFGEYIAWAKDYAKLLGSLSEGK